MPGSRLVALVALMLLVLPGSLFAGTTVVEISGVPDYSLYEGCGPTAAGMILGYWDAHGAGNLIPGSDVWATNQLAIQNMIASPEHFYDYVGYGPGTDRLDALPNSLPATYHVDNSVADFMWSSRGFVLADGWSYENKQVTGLVQYAKLMGYSGATGWWEYYTPLWNDLVSQINAGHPAEFYVASTASGTADDYVTVIGYSDDGLGHRQYEFYNTTGGPAQWADFAPLAAGQQWSIESGTFFDIPGVLTPEPATLALLILGGGGMLLRRFRKR